MRSHEELEAELEAFLKMNHALEEAGFQPGYVLIRGDTKVPAKKGWPDATPTTQECLDWIEGSDRVGIQPGSLGCLVLDCDGGDGPDAAEEWAGERLAVRTLSTSRDSNKAHLWLRLEDRASVRNGKFRVEEPLDGVTEGDFRHLRSQVVLTAWSMTAIRKSVRRLKQGPVLSVKDAEALLSSSVSVIDADFDRAGGEWLDDDAIPEHVLRRLEDPVLPERFRELHWIGCELKRLNYSFDSVVAAIEPYVLAWPGDDAKFEGDLERHLTMVWKKAPAHVPAHADFPDDPSASPEARSMKVVRGSAPDTHLNALAALSRTSLRPRYNELDQTVELDGALWDVGRWGRDLNSNTVLLIMTALHDAFAHVNYAPSKDRLCDAIISVALADAYNPVTDYLDGLEWDGQERMERLFAGYFSCEASKLTDAVSRAFMIGAVARARRPGCKRDEMPILKGSQGAGKSTGLRALFGDQFFSDASLGNLANKDAAMNLHGVWLHEFSELDGMRKSEVEPLKAFLSRQEDRYRAPYAKAPASVDRRCVFAGTTNASGFLKDPSGARRFWPLQMSGPVDVEGIQRDRDQLWAEADRAFLDGEYWTLPPDLWDSAAEIAAAETSEHPWADLIRDFLTERQWVPEEETAPPKHRVLSTELMKYLMAKGTARGTRDDQQRLRSVMEQDLGWTHKKAVRVFDDQRAGYVRD